MDKKIVCIWGDSITWGAFDKEKGGWVERLKTYIYKNSDEDIRIYNLGVSGDNTEDLLYRFECECRGRSPHVIIFSIGINDSQYIRDTSNPRVSLEDFKSNIEKLVKTAKKYSDKIAFIGIGSVDEAKTLPLNEESWKCFDNDNTNRYKLILYTTTKNLNIPYLNMDKVVDKSELEDGVHPNAKGHQKIFEKTKDFILDLINQ